MKLYENLTLAKQSWKKSRSMPGANPLFFLNAFSKLFLIIHSRVGHSKGK